ncbi:MAG: TolC family protein [bacterium]
MVMNRLPPRQATCPTSRPAAQGRGGLAAFALILLCVAAPVAQAQTNALPARKLSLAEAMDLASTANLDVQLSEEKIREAGGRVTSHRADLLPELKATASQTRQDRSTAAFGLPESGEIFVDPIRTDISYPGTPGSSVDRYDLPNNAVATQENPTDINFDFSDTTGPYNFFNAKLMLDVPLIDVSTYRTFESSKSEEKKARLDSSAAREAVMAEVAGLYQSALFSGEAITVLKKKVELHEQRVTLSEDLRLSGVATDLDVKKEKVQLAQVRNELLQAQLQQEQAVRELTRSLDLDPAEEIEFTDRLDFRPLPAPDVAAATDLSFKRRPDYLSQRQKVKTAKMQKDSARAEYYPTLKAMGNYGEQGLTPDDTVEAWFIGAYAQISVFDSFRRSGTIVQQDSQLKQQENRTKDMENQIWNELRQVADELTYNEQAVLVADENVILANDELTEQEDNKAAGTATDLDVVSAEVNLADAKFLRVQSVYGYSLSAVKWYKTIGDVREVLTERPEHALWNPAPDTDAEKANDGAEQSPP